MRKNAFSLIETIIAVVIFSLIAVIVISIYLLNQRLYSAGESGAETVQNGRVIIERFTREIRQAKQIVTDLPSDRTSAPSEIEFQDGHVPQIVEQNNVAQANSNTITLSPTSSSENDYYKDCFIKIISGTGQGQIKKVYSYDGLTKTATIEGNWTTAPDGSSVYRIDTSFYYIGYSKDEGGNILRTVFTYCVSQDSINCSQPESFVSWNTMPPPGSSLIEIVLESPRIIGEYVNNIEYWGDQSINIFLELEKNGKTSNFQTEIFGRNL